MARRARGSRATISGSTWCTNQSSAARLGSWRKLPTKQHGERFAALGAISIARDVDAGAHAGGDPRRQAWQEAEQVIAIGRRTHLHLVEVGQRPQFVAQRAQVFAACLHLGGEPGHVSQAAADGLEVNVVFEQRYRDAPEVAAILRQRGVFELHHVDLPQVDLAVNQPLQFFVVKLAHGVRFQGASVLGMAAGAHQPFGRCAELAEFQIVVFLPREVEQTGDMHFGQSRHLA